MQIDLYLGVKLNIFRKCGPVVYFGKNALAHDVGGSGFLRAPKIFCCIGIAFRISFNNLFLNTKTPNR
jgi:hypothetical protein